MLNNLHNHSVAEVEYGVVEATSKCRMSAELGSEPIPQGSSVVSTVLDVKCVSAREYISICRQQCLPVLGAILHGIEPIESALWPQLHSSLDVLSVPCAELYLGNSKPRYFHQEGFDLSEDGVCQFGVWRPQGTKEAPSNLSQYSFALYQKLLWVTKTDGGQHLHRIWNEVPDINVETGGIERYKQFCFGRALAFDECHRKGMSLPAASAVGSMTGRLNVGFLAGRWPSTAFENPEQVSAFNYPSQYGKRSPSFTRAKWLSYTVGGRLMVSGTAAITGHQSRYVGDLLGQCRLTLDNIQNLRDLAIASLQSTSSAEPLSAEGVRVYLRNAQYMEKVRFMVSEFFGKAASIIYLQADICREELLIEIEAQYVVCSEGENDKA